MQTLVARVHAAWTGGFAVIIGLALLAGCSSVHFVKSLGAGAMPSSDQGLVYGNFNYEVFSVFGGGKFGVVLEDDSGKEYSIRFGSDINPVVIELPPGTYRIVRCVAAADMASHTALFTVLGYETWFEVKSGRAYYIGDYYAEYDFPKLRWALNTVVDLYHQNTEAVRSTRPALSSLSYERAFSAQPRMPDGPIYISKPMTDTYRVYAPPIR